MSKTFKVIVSTIFLALSAWLSLGSFLALGASGLGSSRGMYIPLLLGLGTLSFPVSLTFYVKHLAGNRDLFFWLSLVPPIINVMVFVFLK